MKREWRCISGFKGLYEVSNFGEVWSWITNKMLKPGPTTAGYLTVALRREGRSYTRYVHDLVARAFIPNPKRKRTVNHKKLPLSNNRKTNLEWMTYSENHKHAYDVLGRKRLKGRAVVNSAGAIYISLGAAARAFGVTPAAIRYAVVHESNSCGMKWVSHA